MIAALGRRLVLAGRALAAVGTLLGGGCSGSSAAAVDLVVDSDLPVPDALDEIRVTVTASRAAGGEQCAPITRLFAIESSADLPLRGTIERGTEFAAWMALRVVGSVGGVEVLRKERLLAWPDDERQVRVELEAACRDAACGPDSQCEHGRCVDLPDPGLFDDEGRWDPAAPCDARAVRDDGDGGA